MSILHVVQLYYIKSQITVSDSNHIIVAYVTCENLFVDLMLESCFVT